MHNAHKVRACGCTFAMCVADRIVHVCAGQQVVSQPHSSGYATLMQQASKQLVQMCQMCMHSAQQHGEAERS